MLPLVNEFIQYLGDLKRYADLTVDAYTLDLEQFDQFVQNKKGRSNLKEVTSADIREWMVTLLDEGETTRSVARKTCTLSKFFKYALKKDKIKANPMARISVPKIEKRLPVFVKPSEMEQLLFNPAAFTDDYEGIRDKLIIEMFYSLGIRRAELLGIRDRDIDFDRNTILVTGKRSKQRYLPFANSLKKDILVYIETRNANVDAQKDNFFLLKSGEALYPMLVYRIVVKYLSTVCTLFKKSPHVLRHTFATAMLNNGADLNAVKELLGHTSLAATEVYTHTTFERLQNIYKQAHPRA